MLTLKRQLHWEKHALHRNVEREDKASVCAASAVHKAKNSYIQCTFIHLFTAGSNTYNKQKTIHPFKTTTSHSVINLTESAPSINLCRKGGKKVHFTSMAHLFYACDALAAKPPYFRGQSPALNAAPPVSLLLH